MTGMRLLLEAEVMRQLHWRDRSHDGPGKSYPQTWSTCANNLIETKESTIVPLLDVQSW